MGLSSSEDRMIVAGVVLAWYQGVTDGRTVRQTESIMAKTALCIASYADALSKTMHIAQLTQISNHVIIMMSIAVTIINRKRSLSFVIQ